MTNKAIVESVLEGLSKSGQLSQDDLAKVLSALGDSPKADNPRYLTIEEAASTYRVSRLTLWRHVKAGRHLASVGGSDPAGTDDCCASCQSPMPNWPPGGGRLIPKPTAKLGQDNDLQTPQFLQHFLQQSGTASAEKPPWLM